MAYKRKTIDLFIVQGFYFGAWEDETAETSRREGIARLKEYRANAPIYPYRLIKKRERIATC
jgi:hypothetical protein